MSLALILLLTLVATTPILTIAQGLDALPFITLIAAISLLSSATSAPAADLERLAKIFARVKWLLLIPPAWMVIQLFPLPVYAPSHAIWQSAAAALPDLSFGHITLSVTDTLRSLAIYLSWLVVVMASAITFADRRRAGFCLFALLGATTLTVAVGWISHLFPAVADIGSIGSSRSIAATAAAIGSVLAFATVQRAIEGRQTRRAGATADGQTSFGLMMAFAAAEVVFFGFSLAYLDSSISIAALLGAMTLGGVALMSRLAMNRLAPTVIVGLLMLTAAGILAVKAGRNSASSGLASLATPSSELSTATDRTLRESGWLGTGAGTFQALTRMYQEAGQPPQSNAPSLAIKLATEWGRVSLPVVTAISIMFAGLLIGSALQRGRDSFYPAAAAGVLIGLTFAGYTGAPLLSPAISLLTTVTLGLGLAQAVGRSATA